MVKHALGKDWKKTRKKTRNQARKRLEREARNRMKENEKEKTACCLYNACIYVFVVCTRDKKLKEEILHFIENDLWPFFSFL